MIIMLLSTILISAIISNIWTYKFKVYLRKYPYYVWDKMTKGPWGMRWEWNSYSDLNEILSDENYGDPVVQNKKRRLRVALGLQLFLIVAFVVYLILSG